MPLPGYQSVEMVERCPLSARAAQIPWTGTPPSFANDPWFTHLPCHRCERVLEHLVLGQGVSNVKHRGFHIGKAWLFTDQVQESQGHDDRIPVPGEGSNQHVSWGFRQDGDTCCGALAETHITPTTTRASDRLLAH